MQRIKAKLTYANITSTIALFLALSGATAYAANQLADKSVGAKQLRPGAVTSQKIRKNAVTAPKIEALAIKSGKLASGAVKEPKLANASVSGQKLAPEAVSTSKIAQNAVMGAQVDEASLSKVPQAQNADNASFAESANPVAFAAVDQEGVVDSSISKGQISVHQGIEAGIYCVSVQGFSPRGAQVTPRYTNSGNVTAFVTINGGGGCAAPAVTVQTFNGGPIKAPFYILLYR